MKMMKKVIILIMMICMLASNVLAALVGVVNDTDVNIRSLPSTDGSIVGNVGTNYQLEVLESTKYQGKGCDAGWYKIKHNGSEAYICSTYVDLKNVDGTVEDNSLAYGDRVITSGNITVRSEPSYSTGSKIESLILGTDVVITDTKPSGGGCAFNWYQVKYHNNKSGYVCGEYISNYSKLTASLKDLSVEEQAYVDGLRKSGFPDSYLPYLLKMHRDHPTWNFVAENKGLNFNDVILGEQGKNYLQTTNPAYQLDGILAESGGWYRVNNGVASYYLDPRNFLNDNFIFTFEMLSFNATLHTEEVIKKMFGSSYLAQDQYVKWYYEAGRDNKVSPVHLASRSIQEGASNESYVAVSGDSTYSYNGVPLKGYYNYYNIGAYGDNPVVRGLGYACGAKCGFSDSFGRPWDSREKAIKGGAAWISDGYINVGQDTLYYQKFNTSTQPYYTHQYMTNIQAPTSEGEKIYLTYQKNDLLKHPHTFKIPVYNNMPSYTSLPRVGNTDASLKEIKINGIPLKDFDSDVIEYNYTYLPSTKSINVSVTKGSSLSSVSGEQTYTISDSLKKIELVVTSEALTTRKYTINLIKAENADSIDVIFGNLKEVKYKNYIINISPKTIAKSFIDKVVAIDSNVKVKYLDGHNNVLSDTELLKTGNILQFDIGGNLTNLIIGVKGDVSGDGVVTILDLLKVQKHLLKAAILNDGYFMGGDTNLDYGVTILDLLRIQKYLLGQGDL
ncbi:MAG: SH3 domain-containing protein [Erysipelotrichaceae bacterium]